MLENGHLVVKFQLLLNVLANIAIQINFMQFIMRKFGTKIKVKMTNLIAEYCNLRKENILFILQKLITIKKKVLFKKNMYNIHRMYKCSMIQLIYKNKKLEIDCDNSF